jgi:putative hydrolase
LVADLHIHTVASGHAFSTIEEVAKSAASHGLELIAITDHGPSLPGGAHLYHFWNLRVIPRELHGVKILRGAEANIIDESGKLDIPDELLETLDLVHIAFHPKCGYESRGSTYNTQVLLRAMANPHVDVIAHPGNPRFPLDLEVIAEAAAQANLLLELNNSSFLETTSRQGAYEEDEFLAKLAYRKGMDIVINSDAHIACQVGNFKEAIKLAKRAGFSEERVINSSTKRVLDYLRRKKKLSGLT